MKKLSPALLTGVLLACLFWSNHSLAQTPDRRDSVIVESKTVNPGAGKPTAKVKVYITNKDTLFIVNFAFVQRSLSGGAYMTLATPRDFDSAVTFLGNNLSYFRIINPLEYNNVSPDSFIVGLMADGRYPSDYELPNPVRKALLEIEFDTVRTALGTLELDSALLLRLGGTWVNRVEFVTKEPIRAVDVNFVKGTITVAPPPPPPPPCLDPNRDVGFTVVDIVAAINCVFRGIGDCGPISTPADVEKLLRYLFSSPMPLIPPTPCD